MPYVALGLLGVLVASGMIQVVVQSRAAHASRFRLFGDQWFSAEWWSGCALLVAFTLAALGPILDLAGAVERIRPLDHAAVWLVGVCLWCAAAAVARTSQRAMGASWRIGVVGAERQPLVLRGAFQLVRHPMYTALVVLLGAEALIDPTWMTLCSAPLALLGWEILVRRVEEPHLLAAHPEYAAYRTRVGRFIPHVGTASGPPDRS